MFETNKIDSFFSDEKNPFVEEESFFVTRRMKVVRFFKLFLPSFTALLLGIGVAMFDFESNNDSSLLLSKEEKVYFEKFQMNNPVFEITEKDNRYSIIKAKKIEETSPGKKIYNLTTPDAVMYDKNKTINIVSRTGFYNQTNKRLDLKKDVIAIYNNQVKINTPSATYDFSREIGFGKETIFGLSEKGSFKANNFEYNKKKSEFKLTGNVAINNDDISVETPDLATLFLNENKFIATNATTIKEKSKLTTDFLTAYFKDTKNFEIERATAVGNTKIYTNGKEAHSDEGEYEADTGLIKLSKNVRIIDKNGYSATADNGTYDSNKEIFILTDNVEISKNGSKILTPKAIYFQKKEEFHFFDDVKIIQKDCTATANKGVYYVKKNIAELIDNVNIMKDGNIVKGDKAISDFNTSKSRLIAKNGGRVSGKLIESSLGNKKGK